MSFFNYLNEKFGAFYETFDGVMKLNEQDCQRFFSRFSDFFFKDISEFFSESVYPRFLNSQISILEKCFKHSSYISKALFTLIVFILFGF